MEISLINVNMRSAIVLTILTFLLIFFSIGLIDLFLKIYRIKHIKKRKLKREAIRWLISFFLLRIIAIPLIVPFIISNCTTIYSWRQEKINKYKGSTDMSTESVEAIQNIPFQNEVINETETMWERLLNYWLMYDKYCRCSQENNNFASIRSCYQDNTDDLIEWSEVSFHDSIELVKKVYGSELLPTTEYNLLEVGDIIKSYDDPYDVPADVYKAEFWLWVSSRMKDLKPAVLYQAGRSADDILKVLYRDGNITKKEWLFFGSMAISFYFASIERDDGTLDLTLIYYRVAEIFIYLDKYSPFGKEEAYSRHFHLMAEKALGEVEEVLTDTYNRAKKIPYFSCYYAEIMYDFSKLYPDGEENLTDMCREYAIMCVMGDEGEKYCTTCRDILKKLN